MRLALATAAPQTRGEHPAPQCFARHFQAVVGCQMFRRQRRPEALVPLARIVLAHQLENLLASLLIGSVRSTADVTVHQSLGPARTVTLLQTLRMAVADLQQLGGFGQLQFPSFHSAQHFAAPQLLGTHPCPSHSRLLLRSLRVGDISIGRSRGHYHWASTSGAVSGFGCPGRQIGNGARRVKAADLKTEIRAARSVLGPFLGVESSCRTAPLRSRLGFRARGDQGESRRRGLQARLSGAAAVGQGGVGVPDDLAAG